MGGHRGYFGGGGRPLFKFWDVLEVVAFGYGFGICQFGETRVLFDWSLLGFLVSFRGYSRLWPIEGRTWCW